MIIMLSTASVLSLAALAAVGPARSSSGSARLSKLAVTTSTSTSPTATAMRQPTMGWVVGSGLAVIGVVAGPVLGAGVASLVVLGWWWRRRLVAAAHERALVLARPAAIDLVAAVLGAGGTVSHAFSVLARHGPEAIHPAVRRVEDGRRAGLGFASASEAFLDEAGDAFRPFIRALVATERDGAPVATLLERLAEEGRTARARELDARAKRLPLLLLAPLATCSLPAVVIGSIVPLILVAVGGLGLG